MDRKKEMIKCRAFSIAPAELEAALLEHPDIVDCGVVGIAGGFFCALALRTFTAFPASVQPWVALLGVLLSSIIGLFFGIYPAVRASKLDPVVALRSE